jgi:hypothetical protein
MSVLIQSYLHKAGLYQFNGLHIIKEMSDKALDLLAPEDGLEVGKKSKVKGMLQPGDWSLQKIEYLEGPHGEAEYETCENCKKNIRYVCHIMGDDSKVVGPDCALTLLPPGSEDAKAVEDYVGKRIKKNKFVKNAIKLFELSSEVTPEEKESFERLKKYYDGNGWKDIKGGSDVTPLSQFKALNFAKNGKWLTELLYNGYKAEAFKSGMSGLQFPAGRLEKDAKNISTYAVRKWFEKILNDQASLKALSQSFEKVWEEQVSLRNKKYFLDESGRGFVSEFLEEFKDQLGGTESVF